MAGRWTFISSQEVTGSAVATVTFNGLDGNTDGEYLFVMRLAHGNTGTAREIQIRPNGLTTNAVCSYESNTTDTQRAYPVFSPFQYDTLAGELLYQAAYTPRGSATARQRSYNGIFTNADNTPGSADTKVVSSVGIWDDTSTNITSLVFAMCTSNSTTTQTEIAVGSVIEFWKRAA